MLDYECLRLDVDVYCVPREEEMFSPAQHVEDEKSGAQTPTPAAGYFAAPPQPHPTRQSALPPNLGSEVAPSSY